MKKIDSKLDNEWIKREIFHKDAEWKRCDPPMIRSLPFLPLCDDWGGMYNFFSYDSLNNSKISF